MQLEGKRVQLRSPAPCDAERMLRYELINRIHFERVSPSREQSYYSLEFWQRKVALLEKARQDDRVLRLLISLQGDDTRELIGHATFSNMVRGPMQAANLGYGLAKSAVGHGYMHEALSLAIKFAFSELHLHRIMANYMPHNLRSASVLKKLGFTIEGHAKDYLLINSRWEDHVLTSLINGAWRST